MLGQEADGSRALSEDDGSDLGPAALLRRVVDALERDRVPAVLLPDVKVAVGWEREESVQREFESADG